MLNVWYLCHSGFAVEIDRHFLVFDYWKDTPKGGLSAGVVDPHDLMGTGKTVVVFVSHRHPDHFNPVIFDWKRKHPGISLVLSSDVPIPKDISALVMKPGQIAQEAGLSVRTLLSNDEGVAFLVESEKLRIFHAGDLNWWLWEGEPDDWNAEMETLYKREIDKLKGLAIDLAFVPVDPRLGEHGILGIDHLMRTLSVKAAVPMHFWQLEQKMEALLDSSSFADYRASVFPLTIRGERASF